MTRENAVLAATNKPTKLKNYNDDEDDDLSYDDVPSTSAGISTTEDDDSDDDYPPPIEYNQNSSSSSSTFKNQIAEGMQRFLSQWRVLLLGQFLALLLACSSALSASMHFECNVSSPTFQTVLVFGLMSFHALALVRRNKFTVEEKAGLEGDDGVASSSSPTKSSDKKAEFDESQISPTYSMCCGLLQMNAQWWAYAVFAFVSVEASYLTFLAYRYTTLPSAALLDNTNILAAMIGSRIILKRKYSYMHVLGALICCIGIFSNIASDLEKSGEDADTIDDFAGQLEAVEYPKRMLGDILAILGGVFVGLSDVLIEMFVKDFVSVHEYLGCVGIFGTVIAAIQAILLERNQIAKIFAPGSGEILSTKEIYEQYPDDPFNAPRSCPQATAISLVFGYAVCTYVFNYCMSKFLSVSESALLTLSLLTSDLYSVLFSVFAQRIPPSGLFYVAFLLVIAGVVVYEMAPSPLEEEEVEHGVDLPQDRKRDVEMSRISLSWGGVRGDGDGRDVSEEVDRREIL